MTGTYLVEGEREEFSLRDKRGSAHATNRITYIINIAYKSSSHIVLNIILNNNLVEFTQLHSI